MMLMSADMLLEMARLRVQERLAAAERARLARPVEAEPPAPIELGARGGERRWSLR